MTSSSDIPARRKLQLKSSVERAVRAAGQALPSFSRTLQEGARDIRLDLGGQLVLHSLGVGAVVGLAACLFFLLLQVTESLLIGGLAGYRALRPAGEVEIDLFEVAPHGLSLLVVLFLPALGGLCVGALVAHGAPEIAGGGGDAYIGTFHRSEPVSRKRVAWLKMLATAATLGTGGSAGREGPTMQVGASLALMLSRRLHLSSRERRMLLVSGTAAGLAAMFGTPLGAALLATEVLYRDDFESDALVPAVLASVTSYSVFLALVPSHGHLFAHAARYAVAPIHLFLYAGLAFVLSAFGRAFVRLVAASRRVFARVGSPLVRPALGGLALGTVAVVWLAFGNPRLGLHGLDVGALGPGYGLAQAAIVGAPFVPSGLWGVALFAGFAILKMITTSLTLGSGGSGGDFGPSVAIGGLIGGAYGRAMQLFVDPSLDPGAFALVGMGAFYGGLANVPVSAVVLVCEMSGTYDLLVPLMLTNVLAFVLLRRDHLYEQPASRFDSAAHAERSDVLAGLEVQDLVEPGRPSPGLLLVDSTLADAAANLPRFPSGQDVIPLVDAEGAIRGLVPRGALGELLAAPFDPDALVRSVERLVRAPISVYPDTRLSEALRILVASELREVPVLDSEGRLVTLLDELEVARAYEELTLERRDPVARTARRVSARPPAS